MYPVQRRQVGPRGCRCVSSSVHWVNLYVVDDGSIRTLSPAMLARAIAGLAATQGAHYPEGSKQGNHEDSNALVLD
jgi:hypothetical protein